MQSLAIEAVALRGCAGIVGSSRPTVGLTLRNLNVTAFASMHTRAVFASPVALRSATYVIPSVAPLPTSRHRTASTLTECVKQCGKPICKPADLILAVGD